MLEIQNCVEVIGKVDPSVPDEVKSGSGKPPLASIAGKRSFNYRDLEPGSHESSYDWPVKVDYDSCRRVRADKRANYLTRCCAIKVLVVTVLLAKSLQMPSPACSCKRLEHTSSILNYNYDGFRSKRA
jgi:hypothetical protein